jgi:hypothetical protein
VAGARLSHGDGGHVQPGCESVSERRVDLLHFTRFRAIDSWNTQHNEPDNDSRNGALGDATRNLELPLPHLLTLLKTRCAQRVKPERYGDPISKLARRSHRQR